MALPDNLKAALDSVRGIPGLLGLREYTVTIKVRTWSGERHGLGTKTDVDTVLLVGGYSPKVRQLNQRDVISSGSIYSTQDFEIIVTPEFLKNGVAGGIPYSVLEPIPTNSPTEVFYHISKTGAAHSWFKVIGHDFSNVLSSKLTMRRTSVSV